MDRLVPMTILDPQPEYILNQPECGAPKMHGREIFRCCSVARVCFAASSGASRTPGRSCRLGLSTLLTLSAASRARRHLTIRLRLSQRGVAAVI